MVTNIPLTRKVNQSKNDHLLMAKFLPLGVNIMNLPKHCQLSRSFRMQTLHYKVTQESIATGDTKMKSFCHHHIF